jgi:hypothetical protein
MVAAAVARVAVVKVAEIKPPLRKRLVLPPLLLDLRTGVPRGESRASRGVR